MHGYWLGVFADLAYTYMWPHIADNNAVGLLHEKQGVQIDLSCW